MNHLVIFDSSQMCGLCLTHEPNNSFTKTISEPRTALWDHRFHGEFDPGSGRTLAACLTHASRAETCCGKLRLEGICFSGGRVSNAWATYRKDGDNIPKGVLIPNVVYEAHALYIKGSNPLSDGPASD